MNPKKISELEPGDVVVGEGGKHWYTVVEVVRDEPAERLLRVQWADGGFGIRGWDADALDHEVLVRA